MCELPQNCADCECDCEEVRAWGEIDLRLEALKLACSYAAYDQDSKDVVSIAADFYNFLNGELITSNVDKLDAIADILAD
jgi:hypothetical protein